MKTQADLMTEYQPIRCSPSLVDGTMGFEGSGVLILAREERSGVYRLVGVFSAAHADTVAANILKQPREQPSSFCVFFKAAATKAERDRIAAEFAAVIPESDQERFGRDLPPPT